MKKIIASLLICWALTSCNNGAADGYTFEPQSRLLGERRISIVRYQTTAELRSAYRAKTNHPVAQGRELMAFSAYNDRTCTIHMLDPKVAYQPEWIGHELTHCLYGEFHPSQNGQ